MPVRALTGRMRQMVWLIQLISGIPERMLGCISAAIYWHHGLTRERESLKDKTRAVQDFFMKS